MRSIRQLISGSLHRSVIIATLLGHGSLAFGQALPSPAAVAWPNSGGTLSVSANPPGFFNGRPLPGTSTTQGTLTGDQKAILGSANVTFGPYRFVLTNTGTPPFNNGSVTQTYTVAVWGSAPGQVASATPLTFVKLGEVTRTLTAALRQTVSTSASISVLMPSVFMDVKVVATFSPGPFGRPDSFQFPTTITYPSSSCGLVTPGLSSPTDSCMQGAINPTGVLVPDVMPISIIYAPPGNCSWSNLTFSASIGSAMAVTQGNSTATNTLWNYSAAGGIFSGSSNTTQTVVDANSATASFTSTTAQAFGTSFGLPLQSPGNPSCNAGIPVGDQSATNGPGVGDQFVFVVQPTFLYWDTGGRTTFRLSTKQATGTQETLGVAFVRQIDPARPELRPSFMQRLTSSQLQAIRSLDPMAPTVTGPLPTPQAWEPVAASSGAPLPPSRYIFLQRHCAGAGNPFETTQGTSFESSVQSNLTSGFQSITSSSAGPKANVTIGGFAGLVTLATGGGPVSAFENFGKASSVFDSYVMHDVTTTTITENITTNTNLASSQNNSYAQTVLLHDQDKEVNADLYYDTFFGTIAFNPLSCCNAPQTGPTANSCAFYDNSTLCTVGGTTMHCCPEGTAMIGIHYDQNTFKCAPLANPNGVKTLDVGTVRNNMHVCPFGQVMVGFHADFNQLACQTIPGDPVTSERVDASTVDGFPMHVCDGARLTSAMSGIHLDFNLLSCASDPGLR